MPKLVEFSRNLATQFDIFTDESKKHYLWMKRPFQQRNTEGCAQQTAQLMDQTLQRRMDCRRVECLHTADILCADLSINTNNSQTFN